MPSEIASRGAYSWLPENWQKFLPHERPTVEQIVRDLRPKSSPRAFSRQDIGPAPARAGPLSAIVTRVGGALARNSEGFLSLTHRRAPAPGESSSKVIPP